MQKKEFNAGLTQFLDASPTPFHAVANMAEALEEAGFKRLQPAEDWPTETRIKGFITHNDSSIIAFSGFGRSVTDQGIRLFGAHTDSPCLKLKPQPDLRRSGCLQLGVEVYGGALLNPWFDRDLSLAGRVAYLDKEGQLSSCLVNWRQAVATIPSLAIHLDREANNNRSINPQSDLPVVLTLLKGKAELKDKSEQKGKPELSFSDLLLKQLSQQYPDHDIQTILDYELSFYDSQPAARVGLNNEFIASARLDNLLSCYTGLQAIIQADGQCPAILVCNDHEEVGSVSASGADGPLLHNLLLKLTGGTNELTQSLSKSVLFSADNAHALHPNYADRHDENHGPLINMGPVIKINANQRYATNSLTSALYKQLSDEVGVPYQVFVVRSDMACGSTIGPITAAKLGVQTIDIGAPQWAMHSIRETCGSDDAYSLFKVTKAFMNKASLNFC